MNYNTVFEKINIKLTWVNQRVSTFLWKLFPPIGINMNFRLSYSRINFTVQFLIKMERSLRNETSQHNMSRRLMLCMRRRRNNTVWGRRLCRHWRKWQTGAFDKDEKIEIEKEGQHVRKYDRANDRPKFAMLAIDIRPMIDRGLDDNCGPILASYICSKIAPNYRLRITTIV